MIVWESIDLNIGGQSYYIQDYAHLEDHLISNYIFKITPVLICIDYQNCIKPGVIKHVSLVYKAFTIAYFVS